VCTALSYSVDDVKYVCDSFTDFDAASGVAIQRLKYINTFFLWYAIEL